MKENKKTAPPTGGAAAGPRRRTLQAKLAAEREGARQLHTLVDGVLAALAASFGSPTPEGWQLTLPAAAVTEGLAGKRVHTVRTGEMDVITVRDPAKGGEVCVNTAD